MHLFAWTILVLYALSTLWLLMNAMIQLHLLWHFKKRVFKEDSPQEPSSSTLPFVTIQLPVYNEKYVIGRLLDAVSHIDYPADRLDIQVLDDSDDETVSIIDSKVEVLAAQGLPVHIIRRKQRTGYKAGALNEGMQHARGELIAIFDADFIPDPGFLQKMVPRFNDASVGLVQARWSHLNREENTLTRVQTFLLDTHFSVEQSGRSKAGYFINFSGTAGIWRKSCIQDAGGWDGSVLSEDLDLSYRAQMRGWKLIYDPQVAVPAELPSVIEAFRIQQFRWTKGMAQIARKTIRVLLHMPMPAAKKMHAVFHVLGSFVFVSLFVNALLTFPIIVFRNVYPAFEKWSHYTLIGTLNLVALTLIYYNGTKTHHQGRRQFWAYYPLFLVMYMGLSVQNTIAVIEGLLGRTSAFQRTPKTRSKAGNTAYLTGGMNTTHLLEIVVLCYFLAAITVSIQLNDYFMMMFFVMMCAGLGWILALSFKWWRNEPVSSSGLA